MPMLGRLIRFMPMLGRLIRFMLMLDRLLRLTPTLGRPLPSEVKSMYITIVEGVTMFVAAVTVLGLQCAHSPAIRMRAGNHPGWFRRLVPWRSVRRVHDPEQRCEHQECKPRPHTH